MHCPLSSPKLLLRAGESTKPIACFTQCILQFLLAFTIHPAPSTSLFFFEIMFKCLGEVRASYRCLIRGHGSQFCPTDANTAGFVTSSLFSLFQHLSFAYCYSSL